jgi:phosphocarrier protein
MTRRVTTARDQVAMLAPWRTAGSCRTAMPSRTVNVGTQGGLHTRPSAIITDAVSHANAGTVTLAMEGQPPVDASSFFNVMNLGAPRGTPITVSSDNEDLMHQIADIVAHDHDTDKTYHNRFPSVAYDQFEEDEW